MIYVPNGAMSSGVITNYSKLDTRRIEWNFGVDYGEDYNKVEKYCAKSLPMINVFLPVRPLLLN